MDIFLKGFLIDHNLPAGAAGFFALVSDAVKFFIIIRDAVLHVCSFIVGRDHDIPGCYCICKYYNGMEYSMGRKEKQ